MKTDVTIWGHVSYSLQDLLWQMFNIIQSESNIHKHIRSKLISLYILYWVLWLLVLNNYDSEDYFLLNHFYLQQGQPSCQEDYQSEMGFTQQMLMLEMVSQGLP